MKKLLTSALLAFAASALVAAPSLAGCCFGLCYKRCGCCGCGAKFCVKPYNAFSPVCSGTVFCDGCCPFGSGGGPNFGPGPGGPCAGGMCPGGSCGLNYMGVPTGGGLGCDGACLGSLPPDEGTVVPNGATMPGSDPVVSPSPLPNQMPSSPTSQATSYRPIQNAAYRPVGYTVPAAPVAPRMQMRPQMMAAPSYWGD